MSENETVIVESGEVLIEAPQPTNIAEVTPEVLARRPRKVAGGMWGPFEIGAVAAGALALTVAIMVYMLLVVPSNRELARNRSEADRLEAEKMSAMTKYGEITSTEEQVAKLLTSVDDFETRFLPPAINGRSTLYQRINSLINAYGLTNTTGPDYQTLEAPDQNKDAESDEERGRARYRSLFPGVYVTMTVEGPYQNLRRFIRDIETGNEFVIISTIELEPSDSETDKPNPGAPPATKAGVPVDPNLAAFQGGPGNPAAGQPQGQPTTANPKGKTHGQVVALNLEMAAYFRRANYAPMVTTGVTQ